jgi:hypothetical protein
MSVCTPSPAAPAYKKKWDNDDLVNALHMRLIPGRGAAPSLSTIQRLTQVPARTINRYANKSDTSQFIDLPKLKQLEFITSFISPLSQP